MKCDIKELNLYPNVMSKEQFLKACHISKRTALFLLQSNLIPNEYTGKKTRCYKIKKEDIISFVNDREVNPDKYIAPENWYKGSSYFKPYKVRLQPSLPGVSEIRKYYEERLAEYPQDVLEIYDIVAFTGYNRRTVGNWIRNNKLRGLSLPSRYVVPKIWLLDWLCSKEYNNINRKSEIHVNTLWDLAKQ